MTEPLSPAEVFDRLITGISADRWLDLADLYDERVVVWMPMDAPDRAPIEGREAVRQHFAAAAAGPLRLRARDIVVHTTGDPEVVIAEFTYDGTHERTGRRFTAANIQVLRVRDGLIVHSRDYHDHRRFAAAAIPA